VNADLVLHWFLPTSGDGHDVVDGTRTGVTSRRGRAATVDYLAQIARAAEQGGFKGVLTPTGTWCEDAWIVTAALARETRSLRFLVALRPGIVSPTLAAQMAATFERVSGGRVALNVVTGGEDAEQRRFGDWLAHDERYARTDEFLTIMRGAWGPSPLDFTGQYYQVQAATVLRPPERAPTVYFGGASAAAEAVAARHADVYLAWGEPPEMLAPRLSRMRLGAERHGRRLRFGIRLHVIARDTAAQAWAEADRLLSQMRSADVEVAQSRLRAMDSVGQRRMLELHEGRRDRLVVAPNLWAGIGLVRGGAGTALVGSHEEVAERIGEYHELGFDEFILSGYPHLEEAYRVAEGVMPLLAHRSRRAPSTAAPVPLQDLESDEFGDLVSPAGQGGRDP
jgi:alkanesulfonate monooxygenase